MIDQCINIKIVLNVVRYYDITFYIIIKLSIIFQYNQYP